MQTTQFHFFKKEKKNLFVFCFIFLNFCFAPDFRRFKSEMTAVTRRFVKLPRYKKKKEIDIHIREEKKSTNRCVVVENRNPESEEKPK